MTVQDFLRNADIDKIFDELWNNYYNLEIMENDYRRNVDKDISKDDLYRLMYNKNHKLVTDAFKDILSIKVSLHPETICLAIPSYDPFEKDKVFIDVCCVEKDEFLDNFKESEVSSFKELKNAPYFLFAYNFMYEDRKDILGYTFYPIKTECSDNGAASAIFWELTWFGYDNETAKKNREESKKRLDETADDDFNDEALLDINLRKPKEKSEKEKRLEEETAVKNHNTANSYYTELKKILEET